MTSAKAKAPARPVFGTLNEHLVCTLCKGYFVDATTITECLHSFCRSCIVQYIQGSSFCPRCEVQLHKGSPLRSLKPDKTLQDIVFKLVPNLFHNEMQRRRVYYDAHPQYADQTTPEQRGDCLERFYSPDDRISLSLEYHDRRRVKAGEERPLRPKRYLECPALFTVGLLKRFVRDKFELPSEILIDVFLRRESLADEYTLLDIAYIYPWKRSEPMRFFYRLRDSRVPESDEEVEREMPSLCAAVTARATRASRRASSASSLASPLASPRGSPVPRIKTESPPPAKLTTQPPAGTPQPKPLTLAKPAPTSPPPKVCSPTSTGPKITLTISPSRGTVTSTTTELPPRPENIVCPAPLKSPTLVPVPAPKPATPTSATPTSATPTSATPTSATPTSATPTSATPTSVPPSTAAPTPGPLSAPSAKKPSAPNAAAAPKPMAAAPVSKNFPATITTRTPNGGFITVKNPVGRPPNGMTVGAKIGSPPPKSPVGPAKPVASSPKASPQAAVKTKRHSNGLPVLAPKDPKLSTTTLSPIVALQNIVQINKMAEAIRNPGVANGNARPAGKEQAADDEKNKVETAKAILQLSMGFKRSDTPTDTTLHNRIDNIVKGLQDDESNDGTLFIKSEPSSPEAPADAASPRGSPVPPAAPAQPANAAPPAIPKVNGLTITPIEPGKRKAAPGPVGGVEEKRIKMHDAPPAASKRPAEATPTASGPAKIAKVDKIAESIQQKQQVTKRPPTPKPIATKPSAPSPGTTTKPPMSSPSSFMSFPPAQIKPVLPQAPKPLAQLVPRPAAKSLPPLQPKPVVMAPQAPRPPHPATPTAAQAKPGTVQQNNQTKVSPAQQKVQMKPGTPQQNKQAKPGTPQQNNQTKPTAGQQNNQAKPVSAQQMNQVKPGSSQQNSQAKPGTPQQTNQVKPGTPQQTNQAKPGTPQQPNQVKPGAPQQSNQAKPGTPQQNNLARPGTPQQNNLARPGTPQQTSLARPGTPQQTNQAKPSTPQQNNQSKPGTPQQTNQARPGTPQQTTQAKPGTPQQVNPARPGPVQQNNQVKSSPAQQNNQAKPSADQLNNQAKAASGAQSQQTKPAPTQPSKPANAQQPQQQQQNPATQPSKPTAVPSPMQSPNNQATKKPESPAKSKKPIPDLQRLQRPLSGTTVNGSLSLAEVKEQLAKKGHYSPPSPQQQPQQPNRTPPRLIEISQQRKSAGPGIPGHRDYGGALDLTAASPRAADHGGSWTPPPNFAQTVVKRQQLLQPMLRPPPSSLSSASPSPPADSPGSATSSVSPELFMEQNSVLAQQVQAQAILQHMQLQSLLQAQAQAAMQPRFPLGLKKAIEDWGVKATAKRK
ncbi:nascent polypeptide-associated complex subunit alpha, muscle-specific form-like [Thrips palmi]|uniref:Nascent polypeptide-associated complex subunit alpha, muscle-specific form-like n=1 Tax=Thrips palmi TaxID=161013 RepID=A0A6P8YBI0_THRPL|nr:nascent polypeptide-associated complex subunit alpha, muscle-specific form-like [Thrips palmi]XP_034234137.1 nascent polypeptide-associated complex subunit alpha, muscle-specific form-like [Thrips palmi]